MSETSGSGIEPLNIERKRISRGQRRKHQIAGLYKDIEELEDFIFDLLAIIDTDMPGLPPERQRTIHKTIDAKRRELDFPLAS